MARKWVIMVYGGMIFLTHAKLNGKLLWWVLFIVKCLPLLVCDRPVADFLFCTFVLSPFIFFQLLPKLNSVLQRLEYPILWILIDCLVSHISYYGSYLIIHHFEYMLYNVVLALSNIQYAKSYCRVFTINTHFPCGNSYTEIQMIRR